MFTKLRSKLRPRVIISGTPKRLASFASIGKPCANRSSSPPLAQAIPCRIVQNKTAIPNLHIHPQEARQDSIWTWTELRTPDSRLNSNSYWDSGTESVFRKCSTMKNSQWSNTEGHHLWQRSEPASWDFGWGHRCYDPDRASHSLQDLSSSLNTPPSKIVVVISSLEVAFLQLVNFTWIPLSIGNAKQSRPQTLTRPPTLGLGLFRIADVEC